MSSSVLRRGGARCHCHCPVTHEAEFGDLVQVLLVVSAAKILYSLCESLCFCRELL